MSDEISLEDINALIAQYERRSGWTSKEFLRRVDEGTAPDTFEAMDWRVLLKARGMEGRVSKKRTQEGSIIHWIAGVAFGYGFEWADYQTRRVSKGARGRILPSSSASLSLRYWRSHGVTRAQFLPGRGEDGELLGIGNDAYDCRLSYGGDRATPEDIALFEDLLECAFPKIRYENRHAGCARCGAYRICEKTGRSWVCHQCQSAMDKQPTSGFVYLFGNLAEKYVKIGQSTNSNSRMQAYAQYLPFTVEMLREIPADDKVMAEASLHKLFAPYRAKGEWFRLDEETIAELEKWHRFEDGQFKLS